MSIVKSIVVLGIIGAGSLVGCASSDESTDVGEGNLTPKNPANTADQRALCQSRVAENGAFRNQDLDVGVVRWKCGDVKGVNSTDGHNDFGQEYCEFHAVQEGKVVDKTAKSGIKPAKVECVFTGVYRDVKGDPGNAANQAFGQQLNTQLTDGTGNLKDAKGVKLPAVGTVQGDKKPISPFAVMNGQFNARGAATQLLSDCMHAAQKADSAQRVNAASDDVKCGADGSGCASARDVEACTLIEGNGVGWRNSDPTICGRAARGALCGATYGALPNNLDGFIMTDWQGNLGDAVKLWTGQSTTAPSAPDKCRYAMIDGKPYLHIIICDPDDSAVTNPKYEGNMQFMCSETFGPKIAMTAPIGLVATTAKDEPGFCAEFNKGVATLKSVATPETK
jgi:hypothetical protein